MKCFTFMYKFNTSTSISWSLMIDIFSKVICDVKARFLFLHSSIANFVPLIFKLQFYLSMCTFLDLDFHFYTFVDFAIITINTEKQFVRNKWSLFVIIKIRSQPFSSIPQAWIWALWKFKYFLLLSILDRRGFVYRYLIILHKIPK